MDFSGLRTNGEDKLDGLSEDRPVSRPPFTSTVSLKRSESAPVNTISNSKTHADSSSSLSSTVYEDDEPNDASHRNHLFDSSSSGFFRFHSSSDFFGGMNYDEPLTASGHALHRSASSTASELLSSSLLSDGQDSQGRGLPPINTRYEYDGSSRPQSVRGRRPSSASVDVAGARPPSSAPSGVSRRHRKNSIEMFLSQSPSQALGGDILKLSMDERQTSQGKELPTEFSLDDGSASSSPYSSQLPSYNKSNSHGRRDRYDSNGSLESDGYAYALSPPMMNEDVWSKNDSSQESFYNEYYSRSHTGTGSSKAAYPVSSPRNPLYRSAPPSSSKSMGYEVSQLNSGAAQWSGSSSDSLYNGNGMYLNSQGIQYQAPMRTPPPSMRPSYGRMAPPLPEASPPPSPRSKSMGLKQCKFFVQGHCRMGAKCKFAHVTAHPQLSPVNHYEDASYSRLPRANSYRDLSSSGGPVTDASSLSSALNVEDVRGRVFAMSKDQNGCRLLQEQLDYDMRVDLRQVIFSESLEHLSEMMVDPFGNYLFQKLLERVNTKEKLAIVRRVSGHLVAAALNLHGTRSVQKVVEVCASSPDVEDDAFEEEYERPVDDEDQSDAVATSAAGMVHLPDLIVEALQDDAVRLCIDSNGNHVIQRVLQHLPSTSNQFVFDAVCRECTTVGTHRHGCCVLQRCLDAASKTQKQEVIVQVERHAMKLMQDPYGNYVVQYVLDSCTPEEAYGVIVKPLGHILELSVQKFSSNVIEKCLEKAPEALRQRYLQEIIACPKMHKMLQDQFANYVVQRALSVCSEEQCMQLVHAIRPHLAAMRNTSGGRRITARILKRFPNLEMNLDMGMPSPAHARGYDGMQAGMAPSPHHRMQPVGPVPPQPNAYAPAMMQGYAPMRGPPMTMPPMPPQMQVPRSHHEYPFERSGSSSRNYEDRTSTSRA